MAVHQRLLFAALALAGQACESGSASQVPLRRFRIDDRLSIALPASTEERRGLFVLDPEIRTPRTLEVSATSAAGRVSPGPRITAREGGSGGVEWTRTESLRRCGRVLAVECRIQREDGEPDWAWCIHAIRSLDCREAGRPRPTQLWRDRGRGQAHPAHAQPAHAGGILRAASSR